LPLLKIEQPSGKALDQATGSTSRPVPVIVVDSDVVARNYCAEILIRQGYTVMQFSTIEETALWLDKHPDGHAIALIPATQAVKALALIGTSGRISPIWLTDSTLPQGPYPALKRPFPPAALIETLREMERRIGKK
jgi:DNA-binding NtrC family response regulator